MFDETGGGSVFQFNHIRYNEAEDQGGGIFIDNEISIDEHTVLFEKNEFAYNVIVVGDNGQGLALAAHNFMTSLSTLVMVNNVVYNNGSDRFNQLEGAQRSAVYIKDFNYSHLINNSITRNRCSSTSPEEKHGALQVVARNGSRWLGLYNNIVYENYETGKPQIVLIGDNFRTLTADFNCNCIEDGSIETVGDVVLDNIGMEIDDPSFDEVGLLINEFHLSGDSEFIGDKGISEYLIIDLPSIDYYEGSRIIEGWHTHEVDYGADEYGN